MFLFLFFFDLRFCIYRYICSCLVYCDLCSCYFLFCEGAGGGFFVCIVCLFFLCCFEFISMMSFLCFEWFRFRMDCFCFVTILTSLKRDWCVVEVRGATHRLVHVLEDEEGDIASEVPIKV